MGALSAEQGLELFDAACAADEALVLPVRLDIQALRAQAEDGVLPALLRGLIRSPFATSDQGAGSLARRLDASPEAEHEGVVLEMVLTEVATVLGHASPDAIAERAGVQRAWV